MPAAPLNPGNDEQNMLLSMLPPDEYALLEQHLEPVEMHLHHLVAEANDRVRHLYFPQQGMMSVVTVMEDGTGIEAATVGREGVAGLPIFLGVETTPARLIVQLRGSAKRIEASRFAAVVEAAPALEKVLRRYTLSLLQQVSQSAACNTLHTVEKRCIRWLLMCHDRAGEDEFLLTQEFLAQMLGVRRAGVTMAASALQKQGLIKYSRGKIRILDRAGLENATCECYAAIRRAEQWLIRTESVAAIAS